MLKKLCYKNQPVLMPLTLSYPNEKAPQSLSLTLILNHARSGVYPKRKEKH